MLHTVATIINIISTVNDDDNAAKFSFIYFLS
jgi:hypothetical protein